MTAPNLTLLSDGFRKNYILVIVWILLILYLIAINYKVPYVTMDEFSSVVYPFEQQMSAALINGRPSHVISANVTKLLGFTVPDALGLTPRFLTMLLLALAVYLLARHLMFAPTKSAVVAFVAIVTHQIDWQHNGLIAFFGGYNLSFACFMFAWMLEPNTWRRWKCFPLVVFLLLVSFSSELFVGAAVVSLALSLWSGRKLADVVTSATFVSLGLYLVLVVIVYVISDPTDVSNMWFYLAGGIATHSPIETLRASVLYVFFSIPYASLLFSHQSTWAVVAGVTLTLGAAFLASRCLMKTRRKSHDLPLGADARLRTYFILCVLLVTPQFLMAMQPMKAQWILQGASTRYAFSLYSWICLTILGAVVIRYISVRLTRVPRLAAFVAVAPALLTVPLAAQANINFASSYSESRSKFLQIRSLARVASDAGVQGVELPTEITSHPYILPLDGNWIKKYVNTVYGMEAKLCHAGTFPFSGAMHPGVELVGFHGPEPAGRWTDDLARVKLNQAPKQAFKVIISFSGAFAANGTYPTRISIGDYQVSRVVKPGEDWILEVAEGGQPNTEIVIQPFEAKSPRDLGLNNGDPRKLGVMVRSVRVEAINDCGERLYPRQVCG